MVKKDEVLKDRDGLDIFEYLNSDECQTAASKLGEELVTSSWDTPDHKLTSQQMLDRMHASIKLVNSYAVMIGMKNGWAFNRQWNDFELSVAGAVMMAMEGGRTATLEAIANGEGPFKEAPQDLREAARGIVLVEEAKKSNPDLREAVEAFTAGTGSEDDLRQAIRRMLRGLSKEGVAKPEKKADDGNPVIFVGPEGPIAPGEPVIGVKVSDNTGRPASQWES